MTKKRFAKIFKGNLNLLFIFSFSYFYDFLLTNHELINTMKKMFVWFQNCDCIWKIYRSTNFYGQCHKLLWRLLLQNKESRSEEVGLYNDSGNVNIVFHHTKNNLYISKSTRDYLKLTSICLSNKPWPQISRYVVNWILKKTLCYVIKHSRFCSYSLWNCITKLCSSILILYLLQFLFFTSLICF